MSTTAEWIDKVSEIADTLEGMANMKLQEATAYHKGYVQACEDFGREMRLAICSQTDI